MGLQKEENPSLKEQDQLGWEENGKNSAFLLLQLLSQNVFNEIINIILRMRFTSCNESFCRLNKQKDLFRNEKHS